jgi:hypothetical protein
LVVFTFSLLVFQLTQRNPHHQNFQKKGKKRSKNLSGLERQAFCGSLCSCRDKSEFPPNIFWRVFEGAGLMNALPEQPEIVRRVERLFGLAYQIEKTKIPNR